MRLLDILSTRTTIEARNYTTVQELIGTRLCVLIRIVGLDSTARLDQESTEVTLSTDNLREETTEVLRAVRDLKIDIDRGHLNDLIFFILEKTIRS